MVRPRLLRFATLLPLLGACAGAPPPGPPLEAVTWTLVSLRGGPVATMPLVRVPRLTLRDGRVTGMSGCNRLSGSYAADGPALRFGPAAGTRMACPEGAEIERELLALLPAVAGWRTRPDRLELLDASGTVLAGFSSATQYYACGEAGPLILRREPGDPRTAGALLAFGGRQWPLRPAPAASGVRYVTENGRSPDMSLEWRGKGDEGMLLEAPLSDSRKPEDLRTFARCRETAG